MLQSPTAMRTYVHIDVRSALLNKIRHIQLQTYSREFHEPFLFPASLFKALNIFPTTPIKFNFRFIAVTDREVRQL